MKLPAQPVTWSHRSWPAAGVAVDEKRESTTIDAAVDVASETVVCRRSAGGSLSTPLCIVGILAFCQALLFVVLFLFICARAGAATDASPKTNLELTPSVYVPQGVRDPFGSEATRLAAGGPTVSAGVSSLKLKGILYNAAHPSALVNDQLVELNKPTKVQTERGEVEVKALEITRDMVSLEVGGQKIELRLGGGTGSVKTAP